MGLAATAALMGVAALQLLDRMDVAQIGLWIIAVVLLNLAYADPRGARRSRQRIPARVEIALVLCLAAAAIVLRVVRLDTIPAGLHGDEGGWGVHALALLEGTRIHPFDLGWDYHPALFTWLQAAGMALVGRGAGGLRLVSALAGSLTVVPWYLFLRRAASFWIALVATVLLIVSPWHIQTCRIASNNAFVILFCVLGMAALYEAAQGGRAAAWVRTGTCLGLCFFFGNKAIVLPPLLLGGAAALAFVGRRGNLETSGDEGSERRRPRIAARAVSGMGPTSAGFDELPSQPAHGRHALVLVLAAAIFTLAPQIPSYVTHGVYGPFLLHPSTHLVGNERVKDASEPARSLPVAAASQIERSLLSFFYYSDRGPFLSSTERPLLTAGVAAFFLVGFVYSLFQWRCTLAAFLIAWFAIALQGSILSSQPPQAHHMIALIPVPLAFAAIALERVRGAITSVAVRLSRSVSLATDITRNARAARWSSAVVLIIVGFLVIEAAREYVWRYAYTQQWLEVTEIARAMRDLDPSHDLVLVTPTVMWDANGTIRFLAHGIKGDPLGPLDPAKPWSKAGKRDVAFIVSRRRFGDLPTLRAWYPQGVESARRAPGGEIIVTTYVVPRGQILGRASPGI